MDGESDLKMFVGGEVFGLLPGVVFVFLVRFRYLLFASRHGGEGRGLDFHWC